MTTRRTPQEWQTLLTLYENSQLTQCSGTLNARIYNALTFVRTLLTLYY